MVRQPNLFIYLPVRLNLIFGMLLFLFFFLQISVICVSKFSWESMATSTSLTFYILLNQQKNCDYLNMRGVIYPLYVFQMCCVSLIVTLRFYVNTNLGKAHCLI